MLVTTPISPSENANEVRLSRIWVFKMKRKTRQRLGFQEQIKFWVFVERVGVGVKNVRRFYFFIFWEGGGPFKVFWVFRCGG